MTKDENIRLNNASALTSGLLILTLLTYTTSGLAASAVGSINWLASPAAILGAIVIFILTRGVGRCHTPFTLAYGIIACTWLWAPSEVVFRDVAFYLVGALGSYLFATAVQTGLLSPQNAILLLLIPSAANIAAYLIGANYTETVLDIDPFLAENRFSGFIGHPNALVTRMLLPLYIVILYWKDIENAKHLRTLTLLSMISAASAIAFTGSKKSLLIAIPLLLAVLIRTSTSKSSVSRMIGIFSMLALLAVPPTLTGLYQNGALDSFEVATRIEQALSGNDESTLERSDFVQLGMRAFIDAPIWGKGFGAFAIVTGAGVYSHNNAIELLVNGGIISAAAYYTVVGWALYRLRLAGERLKILLCIASAAAALDVTGVSYSDRGTSMMIGLTIGAAARQRSRTQPTETNQIHARRSDNDPGIST